MYSARCACGQGKGLTVGRTHAFASAPIPMLHLTGVPTTAKAHAQCIFICTQLHFAAFNKYFTAEQCIWVTNEGARGPEGQLLLVTALYSSSLACLALRNAQDFRTPHIMDFRTAQIFGP
ncbi:hypothetical protein B0H11DRAFT_1900611 [Mycena galericulata]|nr:hypothetical protein B0H11DRAFT_1900611 [Mycena galericulata]